MTTTFTVVVGNRVVHTGDWAECVHVAKTLVAKGRKAVVQRATGVIDARANKIATSARALVAVGLQDPGTQTKVQAAIKAMAASGQYGYSAVLQAALRGEGLTTSQAAWLIGEHARMRAARRIRRSLQTN